MSELADCPVVEGAEAILERSADVLRDESNLVGPAGAGLTLERVYFPETVAQAAAVVGEAARGLVPLTVSGARTGITGGAVPVESRWVLSLSRLNRFIEFRKDEESEGPVARVEAGLTLAALGEELASRGRIAGRKWFYPVDPTEATAAVGGTIATDASGARSYRYGSTREWVRALKVVLADGRVIDLRRGEVRAEGGSLRFPEAFGDRELALPRLPRPACKCVAGYRLAPDVDLVDILVGSEGTLGVIVEAELALAEEPAGVLALMCFLPEGRENTDSGLDLVKRFRADDKLRALSIEYFGATALDLLRQERTSRHEGGKEGGGDAIPELPAGAHSAVFVEVSCGSDDEFDAAVEAIDEDLSSVGGSIDDTWVGDDEAGRRRMRALRHGLPEAVNGRIARLKRTVPEIHKVGTDLAVPDSGLDEMNRVYREALGRSGLEYVVFGHAGENHLHVNLIPKTRGELARAKELHRELAREAVRLGGAVTAEHGIGRLKRELLEVQYGPEGVRALRRVKDFFDPDGILNPGVLFPARS